MACAIHSGQHNWSKRTELEPLMRQLPENQSGDGRHRCPYCAYERGRETGLRAGYRRAIEVLESNE